MEKLGSTELLTGGNVNGAIEKRGDTVHRSENWDENIHQFLLYMEQNGFDGIPRFLGIDEAGREILSFLPGYVPGDSFPDCAPFIWSEENLSRMAEFLRRYHDISTGFLPEAKALSWKGTPFSPDDWEVICHNDAAPYNFAYENGRLTGLIDFDVAYPAPRLWDIVYTLYTAVPLASYEPNRDGSTRAYCAEDADLRKKRIALFFDSYGLPVPEDLFYWVERRLKELCSLIRREAAAGNPGFVRMVQRGEDLYYQREIAFIRAHCAEWK